MLAQSRDGQACTIEWECTAGKFNWYYDFDETILILEGSIVIESDDMPPTRYGAGDVIFFKHGAHAKWHVETYVRKLAFCRNIDPVWLAFPARVLRKLYKMMLPAAGRQAGSSSARPDAEPRAMCRISRTRRVAEQQIHQLAAARTSYAETILDPGQCKRATGQQRRQAQHANEKCVLAVGPCIVLIHVERMLDNFIRLPSHRNEAPAFASRGLQ